MAHANDDPLIRQFRDEITENDLLLVELINKRVDLVTRLRAYKAKTGVAFVDQTREDLMIDFVKRANAGPISDAGLEELYRHLVEVSKREAAAE